MKRKVVVTGLGAITPVGLGKDAFWDAVTKGTSGIDTITKFDADGFNSTIAAEVKDFVPGDFMDKKEARRMDTFAQYAVAGTKMAIEDGAIDLDKINRDRLGVILGSGIGGIETFEKQFKVLFKRGPSRISPFFIPMMISNMAAGQIAITVGAKGPNETIVTACASGTNAIGDAFRIIQRGDADMIITGGTEAAITPISVAGFCSMGALSTRNHDPKGASRPFDKGRDGFVIGEGAGILILEELKHALKRGANIYAEIVGYGMTADAHHITAPVPGGVGAAYAMKNVLADAKVMLEQVHYINAHGTSTRYNDKSETEAIKKVFGKHAHNLAVSSTKSVTGHLLGAAGGIEAIASVLALYGSLIPPTMNYETPDSDCDLNYTPNRAENRNIEYAISNSLGFGGHNASLCFKRFHG